MRYSDPVASAVVRSSRAWRPFLGWWLTCAVAIALPSGIPTGALGAEGEGSRITDEYIPLQENDVPERPFTLELGNPFLGQGTVWEGFELPTGAVWQPSFLVFGNYRTAIQTFDDGRPRGPGGTTSEWANRLDLFGNLQLSGTERVLIGFRPLDEDGDFTGWLFTPDSDEGYEDAWNADIGTLFFEGDFGEIFPNLDPQDTGALDIGFSVGRQAILIQEGIMINDRIDAIGIVKNTLLPSKTSNWRVMGLYAWNEVGKRFRDGVIRPTGNRRDSGAHLFGIFQEADLSFSTIAVDTAFVLNEGGQRSSADGFYWGVSGVQRIGAINSALRVNMSHPLEDETPDTRYGALFFGELSWTPHWPHHTHNILYLNGFWGIEEYSSAARDDAVGGPLGRTGILFAAVGLGRYGAPLGNDADDSAGGSLGYQMFFDDDKRQVIVEFGGRDSTEASEGGAVALGARFQQAIHFDPYFNWILQFDVFGGAQEGRNLLGGARAEVQVKF